MMPGAIDLATFCRVLETAGGVLFCAAVALAWVRSR